MPNSSSKGHHTDKSRRITIDHDPITGEPIKRKISAPTKWYSGHIDKWIEATTVKQEAGHAVLKLGRGGYHTYKEGNGLDSMYDGSCALIWTGTEECPWSARSALWILEILQEANNISHSPLNQQAPDHGCLPFQGGGHREFLIMPLKPLRNLNPQR